MSFNAIRRSLAAIIWGPPPWPPEEGEGTPAPSPARLVCSQDAARVAPGSYGVPAEYLTSADRAAVVRGDGSAGSVVSGDGERAPSESDGGMGVTDESGQLASIDHDVSACSRSSAFADIFRDDPGGFGIKSSKRSPWNPWEG